MQNIELFFQVLEKMNNLEAKKSQNIIRKTAIYIFKNRYGYNLYFGLQTDLPQAYQMAKKSEQEFTSNSYKKVFLQATGVFLGTITEEELNYILFIFNKKYSVTKGPFPSDLDKEHIIRFDTNVDTLINTSIFISEENAPQAINEHMRGIKDNYFRLHKMDREERKLIHMNATLSPQDYLTMLEIMKYYNPKDYLIKAYKLSYLEFMEKKKKMQEHHLMRAREILRFQILLVATIKLFLRRKPIRASVSNLKRDNCHGRYF